MRLLLDAHIDKTIATRLRSIGLDVVAATEHEDLIELPDPHLLEHASRDRRAIVTYDAADFRTAARERAANEEHHSGLVLLSPKRFPQGKRYVGAVIAALQALLTDMPEDDALLDREVWLT